MDPITLSLLAQGGSQILGGLFGGRKNRGGESQYNQIPGLYQPLQQQYGQLAQHPGENLNQIGQSFQQSPGLSFAIRQALRAGNNAAASRGMSGTPQHEQESMQTAMNLGNQDYYNWLDRATPMQSQGLQGQQSVQDSISQAMMNQGNMAYTNQQNRNQSILGGFQGAAGTLGNLGGYLNGGYGQGNSQNAGIPTNGASSSIPMRGANGVFAQPTQQIPGYYPQSLYGR